MLSLFLHIPAAFLNMWRQFAPGSWNYSCFLSSLNIMVKVTVSNEHHGHRIRSTHGLDSTFKFRLSRLASQPDYEDMIASSGQPSWTEGHWWFCRAWHRSQVGKFSEHVSQSIAFCPTYCKSLEALQTHIQWWFNVSQPPVTVLLQVFDSWMHLDFYEARALERGDQRW